MVNSYYQKHKERHRKEACERYQNLSQEEDKIRIKRLEKDIEALLKKKKKKDINITWNVKRSCLTTEKKNYLTNKK